MTKRPKAERGVDVVFGCLCTCDACGRTGDSLGVTVLLAVQRLFELRREGVVVGMTRLLRVY
jgi:hypothetical protein